LESDYSYFNPIELPNTAILSCTYTLTGILSEYLITTNETHRIVLVGRSCRSPEAVGVTMLESSRRHALGALNSRYIYGKVVRILLIPRSFPKPNPTTSVIRAHSQPTFGSVQNQLTDRPIK
jgi:hypothetical protein